MTLLPFADADFTWGEAGLPGANAPAGQMAEFESRLAVVEGLTPPDELSDMSDADTSGAVDGDLLAYNSGTGKWEPYTWPGVTYAFSLPFILDGGGSAIATGAWYNTGILIPFACTYIGWVVEATSSSNLVITVQRAANATPTTFASLDTTHKPTLATEISASYGSLAVAVNSYDRIRPSVDSATSVYATVNLVFQRTI